MPLFEWNPEKYSVRVQRFDDQHQKLFSLINELHDAMLKGKAASIVSRVLSDLKDYTITHFSEEEAAMARVNYAGLGEQKTQHANFVNELEKLMKEAKESQFSVKMKTAEFLTDWLRNHIAKTDKKYAYVLG